MSSSYRADLHDTGLPEVLVQTEVAASSALVGILAVGDVSAGSGVLRAVSSAFGADGDVSGALGAVPIPWMVYAAAAALGDRTVSTPASLISKANSLGVPSLGSTLTVYGRGLAQTINLQIPKGLDVRGNLKTALVAVREIIHQLSGVTYEGICLHKTSTGSYRPFVNRSEVDLAVGDVFLIMCNGEFSIMTNDAGTNLNISTGGSVQENQVVAVAGGATLTVTSGGPSTISFFPTAPITWRFKPPAGDAYFSAFSHVNFYQGTQFIAIAGAIANSSNAVFDPMWADIMTLVNQNLPSPGVSNVFSLPMVAQLLASSALSENEARGVFVQHLSYVSALIGLLMASASR